MKQQIVFSFAVLLALTTDVVAETSKPIQLFDMKAMHDVSTLDVDVLQDWHTVAGVIPTRQMLITIHVGEFWQGKNYRVPVRMVVPMNQKAKGFHLTGGNHFQQLQKDIRLRGIENELIKGGVGLVYTVVQEHRVLGEELRNRFAKSLNPHHSIQYWGWPASMMRTVTAAYAEQNYFDVGKVAMSGGSKNGATPSLAIIHDKRMTAVHSSVAPIWDSPLRLCDQKAWKELKQFNLQYADKLTEENPSTNRRRLLNHAFLGGTYGPIYNQAALNAGNSWADIEKLAQQIAPHVFISKNFKALKLRGAEFYFHPGTHDFVAFDLQWGGKHHPEIPIYLRVNSGHGKRERHPASEKDEQNKSAFLLQHFFNTDVKMLDSPKVNYKKQGNILIISVQFKKGSQAETGRIWWMFDRAPDGSAAYIRENFPDEQWADMHHDKHTKNWVAEIELDSKAKTIDFFSNHRKTIEYKGKNYPTYISSPYSRVVIKD